MSMALFADAALIKLIFFGLVGIVWVISQLGKAANWQNRAKPLEPPRPMPRPRPPATTKDPTAELEQFLNELGVRSNQRTATPSSNDLRPSAPERKPLPRPRVPKSADRGDGMPRKSGRPAPKLAEVAKQQSSAFPAGEKVEQRHLVSQLEGRHRQEYHSQLESKHLDSQFAKGSTSAMNARPQDADGSDMHVATPLSMAAMLRNRNHLVGAFVLGEVLGPPLSSRE